MTRQEVSQETNEPLTTADLVNAGEQPQPVALVDEDTELSLLDARESESFSGRWSQVQTQFVDDPRGAVRDADALVAEVMRSLAQGFASHKGSLEEQWSRDDQPDTEQLRQALRRYRVFFSRLLAT